MKSRVSFFQLQADEVTTEPTYGERLSTVRRHNAISPHDPAEQLSMRRRACTPLQQLSDSICTVCLGEHHTPFSGPHLRGAEWRSYKSNDVVQGIISHDLGTFWFIFRLGVRNKSGVRSFFLLPDTLLFVIEAWVCVIDG